MSVQGVTNTCRSALADVISTPKIRCRKFDVYVPNMSTSAAIGQAQFVLSENYDQSYGFRAIVFTVRLYHRISGKVDASLADSEQHFEIVIDNLCADRRLNNQVASSDINSDARQSVIEIGDAQFIMTEFEVSVTPFPNAAG